MFAQSLSLLLIFLTIIAGIFFNNKGLTDLKAEIKADMKDMRAELKAEIAASRAESKADLAKLEGRLDARLNSIDASLLQFSELKGHLEGRIDEIAKRVAA